VDQTRVPRERQLPSARPAQPNEDQQNQAQAPGRPDGRARLHDLLALIVSRHKLPPLSRLPFRKEVEVFFSLLGYDLLFRVEWRRPRRREKNPNVPSEDITTAFRRYDKGEVAS
jgi:hypothetical protein